MSGKSAWGRLQDVSCYHAFKIWEQTGKRKHSTRYFPIRVPEVIRENVEILGKGT
jgi:hypothetical protein